MFTQELHTVLVVRETPAIIMVYSEVFPGGESILVSSQELELPIVYGLLTFDAIFDVLRGVLPACIFHPVRDDDAKDMFRAFGFRHLGEPMTDRINGRADSIIKSRAAGAVVLRHEVIVEDCEVSGLDRPFYFVVELEEVEHGLSGFFSLFLQKSVERAPDVIPDARHGAGGVKDDDKVCVVVFDFFLLI